MARRYKRLKLEYELPVKNIKILDFIKNISNNNNLINTLDKVFYYSDSFITTLPTYEINNINDLINPIPSYEVKLSEFEDIISKRLFIDDLYKLYKNTEFKKYIKKISLIGFINDYVYKTSKHNFEYYNNFLTINNNRFIKSDDIKNNGGKYIIYKYKISNINIHLNSKRIYYYSNKAYSAEVDIIKCKGEEDLKFKEIPFHNNFLLEDFRINTKGNKTFDCENIIRKGPPYDTRCLYSNKVEDILKSIRTYFIKTELSI